MGHGSWFSTVFGTFYQNMLNLLHVLGWPGEVEGDAHTGVWSGPLGTVLGGRYPVEEIDQARTQAFLHVGLVFVLLAGLAFYVSSKIKDRQKALVPSDTLDAQNVFEVIVGATYGLMKDIMGDKPARFFLPLIGTCAFFILFSNALGLIPGFLPPTSSLSVTLACGLVIFVVTHIFGVKEHGLAYFKHFFGPIIKWYALPLMLLMFVVELISHFVRPLSLGIRLMANMFADHAVVGVFVALVPFVVPVPVLLLGTLVVVVQALVFCILSTVYISMAIEHGEEH
ncbi:MAG: F0F1 ATP synthase subunit A [Sandaracinaceae bacterium]|nr:F0F1 ATP synthase subunit A [Sandaracinaceae bacterium]